MTIVSRNSSRILFAGHTSGDRVGSGAIAGAFFVFGLIFLSIAVRALLTLVGVNDDVRDPKVIGTFSLLLGSVFLYIGAHASLVALPFQLVLTRDPVTTCFVWRSWQVKRKRFAEPSALIAELSRRPRSIVFVLSVRTPGGEASLLTSNESWSVPDDARKAAVALGGELAGFLRCPLETRWEVK